MYSINSRVTPHTNISKDGLKFRPDHQLTSRSHLDDPTSLDLRTNKTNHTSVNKPRHKIAPYDHPRGYRQDASLVLPIRQTASIFKQPVTVIRNHNDSKTQHDLKHGPQDTQPKQLFWEKGLEGLNACDSNEEVIECLELPTVINGVGPGITTQNVIQSIAAALHLSNQPVVGQSTGRIAGNKNLGVTLDTNQPHMKHTVVSEDDVKRQENKVKEMRERLTEAFKGIA